MLFLTKELCVGDGREKQMEVINKRENDLQIGSGGLLCVSICIAGCIAGPVFLAAMNIGIAAG